MSPPAAAPGHIGNLTTEQEEKLRKLWNELLKLCGVANSDADANGSMAADAAPAKPAPAPEDPDSPQKRRFSLFRRKNIESSQTSNSSTSEAKDGAESNDKYGQTKQFQKTLESQTPESIRETIWSMVKQDNPDALVLRFLRARKWDVQQALVMLVSAMDWRHTDMHVDSDIIKNGEAGAVQDEQNGSAEAKKLAGDFMAQSRQGKSFLHGTDKEGRPICVVRVRLHKPGAQSAESLERSTVFIIETARLSLQPPVDTATIIFDMTGFSMANMDYQPVKFMIQCFEANYPESLGAVLVHNAPWVFQGIWRIIRGWLDPVVAAKVHFTNYKAGLEEFIEPSHIIKELEGDEDWEYKYEEPVEGENDRMKDTKTRDRLLEAREELYKQFEAETRKWIRSTDSDEGKQAKAQREKIAEQLRVGYWELDPYLRSRSLYDRQGIILPGGGVDWYKSGGKKESAPQTNGTGDDASASTKKEA
ncbi:CRAL/TRIO domain protein [Ophiocordyceps sinensis CO18]|nr:CRAL/TRIO domain protein [Ophiocordyceps sinensis CO18]